MISTRLNGAVPGTPWPQAGGVEVQAHSAPPPIGPPQPAAIALRIPLDLPEDIWSVLAGFLIPTNPFMDSPTGTISQFPIASAMRSLRSLDQACVELHGIVTRLRRHADFLPFRTLASWKEYRNHNAIAQDAIAQARTQSLARYQVAPVAPVDPDSAPERMGMGAHEPADMSYICQQLQAYGADIRVLHLHIHDDCLTMLDQLRSGLSACTSLRSLQFSTTSTLPSALAEELEVLPPISSLILSAPGLPPNFLAQLANARWAARLESIELSICRISPSDLHSLREVAPRLRRLRFLAVNDAPLSEACCQALQASLAGFPCLESLQLGRRKGSISACGALAIVEAARAGEKLSRLGLHHFDETNATGAVFSALEKVAGLKEFAFTGPLGDTEAGYPWRLMKNGPVRLRALDLESCGMNEPQMISLAAAVESSSCLTELRLAGIRFTDEGACQLSRAIKANTSLLRLVFKRCVISEDQAYELHQAIASSKSLLELKLGLTPQDTVENRAVADTFSVGVQKSSSLLRFTHNSNKSSQYALATRRLMRNRLR
jgi:hypothetical protein